VVTGLRPVLSFLPQLRNRKATDLSDQEVESGLGQEQADEQRYLLVVFPRLRWHNGRFDIAHNPEQALQPTDEIRLLFISSNRLGNRPSVLADGPLFGLRSQSLGTLLPHLRMIQESWCHEAHGRAYFPRPPYGRRLFHMSSFSQGFRSFKEGLDWRLIRDYWLAVSKGARMGDALGCRLGRHILWPPDTLLRPFTGIPGLVVHVGGPRSRLLRMARRPLKDDP
jgi:hypothetical protein